MANPFTNGYREPQAQSNYLKFKEEGSYVVRILTPKTEVVTYFTCFTDENKKIVLKDNGDGQTPNKPIEAKENPKLVWAVKVLNLDNQKVQVWEIPQSGIRQFLFSIATGKIKNDWTKFDLQITKTGQGLDTTYSLMADDTRPLTEQELVTIETTPVNLLAMDQGGDPFDTSKSAVVASLNKDIEVPDINIEDMNIQMPF